MQLLEKIWLFTRYQIPQRLKLEPSRLVGSNLLLRSLSDRKLDVHGRAGGYGQQPSMAAPVHRDKPPRRFIDRMTDCQQSMILQNDCFVMPERFCNAFSLRDFVHDTGEVGE